MKNKIIISFMALTTAVFMATGCGASSETEETITEEIVEEISETEIEEEPAETEEEAEDVEDVTEEDITTETTETAETEAIDEDTMAALKEALDPDVHLTYEDLDGALSMPTMFITFDDTATEAISTLYELVYKETLGTGDEAGIQITGDNVKVMAGYYYRESISKEEYYEAIFDTEYYDTLLASLNDGTYVADESGTYYVVPGTETSPSSNSTPSSNTDNTNTGNTNTNNNNSGSSGGSTGSTGSGSGSNAAVEEYTEGTQNQSSTDMANILGGTSIDDYGDISRTEGLEGIEIH